MVTLAAAALGGALLLLSAVYLGQERLIFFPQPLSEVRRESILAAFPTVREIIRDGPGGVRLHAWHVPASAGAPVVLYFGGNAEDVSGMLVEAPRRAPGVAWLLVSYRGYGASEGSPGESALIQDALDWHDEARRRFQPSRIFVFGRSLGSGVAARVAAERPVDGVVLVTPFDSLAAVARRHYPFLPVDLLLRHRFDSVVAARMSSAPLLCIAASDDLVIPVDHARRLYDAWTGMKRWIELRGAGHNGTDASPEFWPNIAAFLQQA